MLHKIHKALYWVLLAPALLPLLYIDGMLYPYLAPKTLLLRALGVIVIVLFAYLSLSGAPMYWERLRNKISWIPGALLGVAYLTSLIGVDFYISFWSTFERGDGLLTLTVIAAFFYVILLSVDKTFFAMLYKVVAWVGSLVAVHALLQWISGISGTNFPLIAQTGDRLGGTLGNPAFLASYLSLSLVATLVAARRSSKPYNTILYVGAALQLLAVLLTATRGSILALVVAGLALLIYLAIKSTGHTKTYARGGAAGLLVVLVLFIAFRGALSHSSLTPISRVASLSLNDPTVSSRLFLWKNLTKEALPHTLTGVGAEHVTVLFDKVYDPSAIDEQWFDRSHNSFLDYFIQFGIAGLLLYVALVLSVGWVGWRLFAARGNLHLEGVGLLAITAIYAVQNFFVFDTAVVLWLLAALFAAALGAQSSVSTSVAFRVPSGKWMGLVVGVALALLLIPVSIQPLRANIYLADAYFYHVADAGRSVDSMQKGFALNTYANLEYGYQAYQMYTGEQLTKLGGADRVAAYNNTESILQKNFNRYSYDARTVTYFAHVLDSVPPGATPPKPELLQAVLAKAIELSPKRSQPWYIKANIYIEQGDTATNAKVKTAAYAQAIDVLQQYVNIEPNLAEPRYVVATLYLTSGDKKSATKWAEEGLSLYHHNADEAGRAVKYYIATEDWPHAVEFLQDIVDASPTDYDSTYDLAKANYLAGNKDKAIEIVAYLRKVKPGFVESDQPFLKALGQ